MEAGLLPLTKRLFSRHPYKKAGADYDNNIMHNTKLRLASIDIGEDIFSKLLTNKGDGFDATIGEIFAEGNVMLIAGTDTTTSALTNTIYLLCKNPRVLKKLRTEVDLASGPGEIPTYESLASLPYPRACIEETLRVRPASSFGLPRVVPKGGGQIAGDFVAEDVTVSVPTYTLLRDKNAFEQPDDFIPERWIEGDKEKMAKAPFPFSTGPRVCSGRNIAYFEPVTFIGTLVRLFDLEFSSKDFELQTPERFNSNPVEMEVMCHRRSDLTSAASQIRKVCERCARSIFQYNQ